MIACLSHLEKLANCDCSKLPYSKYIRELLIFYIFADILFFNLFYYSNYDCNEDFLNNNSVIFILSLVFSSVTIFIYIRLYLYLRTLKQNCKCAYGEKESFIYWYLIILFSLWISLFIISFISGVLGFSY